MLDDIRIAHEKSFVIVIQRGKEDVAGIEYWLRMVELPDSWLETQNSEALEPLYDKKITARSAVKCYTAFVISVFWSRGALYRTIIQFIIFPINIKAQGIIEP